MGSKTSGRSHKSKLVAKNVFFGFGTKLATMILGIVIPRLFIVSYGSEVNGLLSTITQIFSYLALLEAGIGTATVNALYQPLDCDNYDLINIVVGQAKAYYKKVTGIYAVCIVAFSAIYPFLSGSTVRKEIIFAVILLQGGANCISYYFCATYTQLLLADGKQYVMDNILFAISVGTSIIKITLVSLGCSIVFVQLGFFVVSLCKIPLVVGVCRKWYPWMKPAKTKEYGLIKDRGAFVIHEVASTIFSNTDIFIISAFCSLSLASVYSVYNLVFGALNSMINTANAGLGFLLGQNYYKDKKRFCFIYDCYSTWYSVVVFIVMTVAYILIFPFVRLYTKDVTDINYIINWLPLLFVVVNIMSGVRAVAARLITVSGHAEQTASHSVFEMIINLVASIVLVFWFGIYGVLIGTIIALLYRMNDIIIYANKVILRRSPWNEYKGILINSIVFCIIIFFSSCWKISVDGYFDLAVVALMISFFVSGVYVGVTLLTNIKSIRILLGMLHEFRMNKRGIKNEMQ